MNRAGTSSLDASAVVELRQYTLHPGKRDTLIELFERCFVESQEALGMRVLGTFRDADDPDRFVWLRGFRDMTSRGRGLPAFYGGPTWKANREAANATMIDSDDVLLLRPVRPASGFIVPADHPAVTAEAPASSLVVATLYLLREPVDEAFLDFFESRIRPPMTETGAAPLAVFRTEYAANNFPPLPVREGEHAFVWFSSFAGADDHARHLARLEGSSPWREAVAPELARRLASPVQSLRLLPTARSLVRHPVPD
jgi:hypothetical protein